MLDRPTHSRGIRILVLGASLFTVASALAGDQDELPLRKAGVWELKTTMDEGSGPRDHAFKMCIDQAMERNTAQASLVEHKANCASYKIKRENNTTTVDADCVFNQASVQSKTEMSGDFETKFEIKIESTTVPQAPTAQSRPVKRTIVQTGSYLGADCGELQPGEAMTADGNKVMAQ